jgi:hypothetical protein
MRSMLARLAVALDAADGDPARAVGLEPVDAADQRRLARPGRAADHHALARRTSKRDVLQHLEVAEMLGDAFEPDDRGSSFRHPLLPVLLAESPAGSLRQPLFLVQQVYLVAIANVPQHDLPSRRTGESDMTFIKAISFALALVVAASQAQAQSALQEVLTAACSRSAPPATGTR